DVAAGEQQRAFLAVEVGKLALQLDVIMRVAADVAGAAAAGADVMQRLFHRLDHLRVLAHRQVIVRAPHGDRLRPVVVGEAARSGILALLAQNVDEHAIPSLTMKALDRLVEDVVVVQRPYPVGAASYRGRRVNGALRPWVPTIKARSLREIRN